MREEQPCPCSRPSSASPESSSGFWRAPVQHPSSGAASAVAVAQTQPDTDPGCSLSRSNGSPGSCAGSSGVGQQPQLSPAQTWGLQLQGQEGSRKRGREMCAVIAEPLPAPCAAPAALKNLLGAVTSVKITSRAFPASLDVLEALLECVGPCVWLCSFPWAVPQGIAAPSPCSPPWCCFIHFPLAVPCGGAVPAAVGWSKGYVHQIHQGRAPSPQDR